MPRREDNPFISRRISNIFAGPGQDQDSPFVQAGRRFNLSPAVQQVNTSAVTQPDTEEDPMLAALQRMQGGKAANAYREHIGMMPERDAYAPSQGRRLGAALIAGAASFNDPNRGAQLGDQVMHAPYRNALEDWSMKGAGLKEQANIEQDDATGQLNYMKAVRQHQLDQDKNKLEIRRVEADELRARTDQARQQAQEDNYKRQGWTFYDSKDGMRMGANPNTGEITTLGPSMAGRQQEDRERGTDISAYSATTGRINAGINQQQANTSAGNLGQRQAEFGHRQGQDVIQNAQRDRALDQSGMNAGSAGFVPSQEQYQVEALAAQDALKENPDWAGWVNPDGTIKKAADYDNWGPFNGTAPTLNTPGYRDFLAAVERATQRRMGTRRPGIGEVPGRVGPVNFNDLPD